MKIVGLITEYNPFHNGHQYHIDEARKISGADYVLVVMSGNYVQRGTPAIMPKHIRANIALSSGADLVIELPTYFATGTAEVFAFGAVTLLHSLGVVDSICFGSECGDIEDLTALATLLTDEPFEYKQMLQDNLRLGMSFPSARHDAIARYTKNESLAALLNEPNNILALEYLKALRRLKSNIKPYTIQRKESSYHDVNLGVGLSSASAIRNAIKNNGLDANIWEKLPLSSHQLLKDYWEKRFPIFTNDFSLLLKQRLLTESATSLLEYADVSESLANRIIKHRNQFIAYEQFCELLKTKEITYSRISRALLHILLGIKKEPSDFKPSYARVLGFRKNSASMMTAIKSSSTIPLVTKLADAESHIDVDVLASNLYESVVTEKFKTPFVNEYEQQIVRI